MTIGDKIKKARKLLNMTQAQLGHLTNQHGDRIRSYETGVRTPKAAYLEAIVNATGFPVEYFTDHKIDSYADFFQVFFELEDNIGLTVEPTADGKCVLTCNDVMFESYLRNWYEKKEDFKNGKCSKEEYDIWRARFPISVADDMHADMRNRMKNNSENDK